MSGSENLPAQDAPVAPAGSPRIGTIPGAPDDAEVLARLTKLSKAGKLAGFEPGEDGRLASFTAYGTPFDGRVDVRRDQGVLAFDLAMPCKLPAIFAIALVLSVWPGLPLTDSFLQGFGWYARLTSGAFQTWMWYIPLAAIPAPFALLGAMKKSKATASEHARETFDRLRAVLEG